MTTVSALWRRLDVPGHDACHVISIPDGWLLEGRAAFAHEGAPAQLAYQVACDSEWKSVNGHVLGWLGDKPVELSIERPAPDAWSLDDQPVPDLADCLDLDFGFTPATNLLQLRRLALEVGQAADVPVAWLDVKAGALQRLTQRYERRSATTYWYEAPSLGYAALLEVEESGLVRTYPNLWVAET